MLPQRWIVERTFGWLTQNRRLVRDHETPESSAEAFVYLAMIRLMLNRLAWFPPCNLFFRQALNFNDCFFSEH
jgi:hypothetical protein